MIDKNIDNSLSVVTAASKPLIKKAISTVEQLANCINFDPNTRKALNEIVKQYNMLIPSYYFSLIKDPNDEQDPIRKQCVPVIDELFDNPSEKIDPLGGKRNISYKYISASLSGQSAFDCYSKMFYVLPPLYTKTFMAE